MRELTIVQRCQLRRHRCFFGGDADNPGWTRFYSAEPRFPLNIAFPEEMVEPKGSWRFHPYQETYQELEFPGRFIVVRTDLTKISRTSGQLLSAPLLDGDVRQTYRKKQCGRRYRIGGLSGSAPDCIRYDNGAVRVHFVSSTQELWNFERAEDFSDDVFARILENAHFLSERFFGLLPPPAEDIECYHEWETLYFYAPRGGVFMDTLGVDCDVHELARRWPGELRAVFHQRVWWSELKLAVVDLVVTRPNITRTPALRQARCARVPDPGGP